MLRSIRPKRATTSLAASVDVTEAPPERRSSMARERGRRPSEACPLQRLVGPHSCSSAPKLCRPNHGSAEEAAQLSRHELRFASVVSRGMAYTA